MRKRREFKLAGTTEGFVRSLTGAELAQQIVGLRKEVAENEKQIGRPSPAGFREQADTCSRESVWISSGVAAAWGFHRRATGCNSEQ
jgi:hypothetical protein